jgi:RNA recognition motif-containing protein
MAKTIYVGNLPFSATEDQVRDLFAAFGAVTAVKFVNDRDTGRFRGFAFVEMAAGADEAIRDLDGKDLGGRALRVNEAKERAPRSGTGLRRRSPYRTA